MKVLIAEDDAVSRRVAEVFLRKWEYEVTSATNGTEAWEALEAPDAPRLVLLDWMMPGLEGVEICRRLRAKTVRPYVYIVLLTARGQKQNLLDGLEAGADDYLTKPFEPEELRARLRVGQRILAVQDELIAARDALLYQATHDALTGAYNRGESLEFLSRELGRGLREGRPVGVALADIDHFKQVNDAYGHLTGDAVLREVTRRLSAVVRSYDCIGRYGGEEFLIVLPSVTADVTFQRAQAIREIIGRSPFRIEAREIRITASLGAAASDATAGCEAERLLGAADAALYRAKQRGRDCVEFATAEDFVPAPAAK